MSFHEKMAQNAVSIGKTSLEFKKAAQRHADATWYLVMSGGVIWYFFGWPWGVILVALGIFTALKSVSATIVATRLENYEHASESAEDDFLSIVQAYGKILELSAPALGTVADISKLPFQKQQIKHAIVAALQSTDDPQMKDHLCKGYILLADWQEGVGETNQGFDVSILDMNLDEVSRTKAVLDQLSGSEKWIEMVQKEQEELKEELQALGLW